MRPENDDWNWHYRHRFELGHEGDAERRTWIVAGLTATMMVVEIAAGLAFNSMALLADGWHMTTHAGVFVLAGLTYFFQRRHADNPKFTFGTGKVSALAGFASALILGFVAMLMIWEAANQLYQPSPIAYDYALLVAVVGLVVNVASAWLLARPGTGARRIHDHAGAAVGHVHIHDHNLRAAYLHVLADALTSVAAIVALSLGMVLAWNWADPVAGLLSAIVIIWWCYGLMMDSGATLLDHGFGASIGPKVRDAIESEPDSKVVDMHIWRIAPGHEAAIISIVTNNPRRTSHYRSVINSIHPFSHLTVEIHRRDEMPGIQVT